MIEQELDGPDNYYSEESRSKMAALVHVIFWLPLCTGGGSTDVLSIFRCWPGGDTIEKAHEVSKTVQRVHPLQINYYFPSIHRTGSW